MKTNNPTTQTISFAMILIVSMAFGAIIYSGMIAFEKHSVVVAEQVVTEKIAAEKTLLKAATLIDLYKQSTDLQFKSNSTTGDLQLKYISQMNDVEDLIRDTEAM